MREERASINEQRASRPTHEARCSKLVLLLAVLCGLLSLSLVAGRWALVAAQDPGSMASRVQRPVTCSNGEVLTYNSASQQYECQPAAGGGVPAGAILLIVSGSCPSGYAEETSLDGRLPLGTLAAHADIGSTGGQIGYGVDTSTSGSQNTGLSTVSTGSATGSTASVSAGTPGGTVSQPTFTGTQFDNRSAFVRVIFCRKT